MGKYLLLTGFLLFALAADSQDFNPATWNHIDTSIENGRNLSDINQLVQQLKQKAATEERYFDLARCYYYQVRIADERTEDSFYFRNSAVYDSLLMTPSGPMELQFAAELLLAKRLVDFARKSRRFVNSRYESAKLPVNYAKFNDRALDSIATTHFEKAKSLARMMPLVEADRILWIATDSTLFFFRPGLFDIAIAEQIQKKKPIFYTLPRVPAGEIGLLKLAPDEFISKIDAFYNNDSSYNKQLDYYREWLDYYKAIPPVYYYLETLLRKHLYQTIKDNTNAAGALDSSYQAYLRIVSSSQYLIAKACAIYQLCLLLENQSARYFPAGRRGYNGYDRRISAWGKLDDYDTSYRYHAREALQLYEQNHELLNTFPYLGDILRAMKERILAGQATVVVEEYSLPNEPMLAELTYKNATKLYYSIVRMNAGFTFRYASKEELIAKLRQLPEVINQRVALPGADDYNWHAAYVKMDGLPAGTYALLYSQDPINDTNKQVERVYLKVTSVAIVNNINRVFVLDRKTGFPLAGALVKGYYGRDKKDSLDIQKIKTRNYIVNEQGFVDIADGKIENLEVRYKGDTSFSRYSFTEEETPDIIYSKEEYDNLADFYDENAAIHVFTDRSIYRPGQTVHFKAIFTTVNKNTGEPMVINKENLGKSFVSSVYKKWLKDADDELYLEDPFNRKVDTIKVKLNEYGSVSGSFKIPKTAATGQWSIEPYYTDSDGGSFRVEEYKRPSYEITVENPKKELLPGDTFSVKAIVRSFAGSTMSNVRVHYSIDRAETSSSYDRENDRRRYGRIADTTGYTNQDGELVMKVVDTFYVRPAGKERRQDIRYEIKVKATDGTGETYEANTSVRVLSRPVTITLETEEAYSRNAKNSITITAEDDNAGIVSKDIRVKVSRRPGAQKTYGDRRLVKADTWLYPKEQLQQWFPLVDMTGETDTSHPQLVLEKTINTGKMEKLELDPAIFLPGNYIIEAECISNGLVLGTQQEYFSVFDEKENKLPAYAGEFHHLAFNSVAPGDTIRYYSGSSEGPVYAIYYLSWYAVDKKLGLNGHYEMIRQEKGIYPWKWKLPANAKEKLMLTRVYVFNNQLYSDEQEIAINQPAVEPEIVVEQYRKKLSPSSKETFSVSIKTKNENTAAELMTTLYDASLDKLHAHNWDKPETENDLDLDSDWDPSINSIINSRSFPYWNYYDNGKVTLRSSQLNPVNRVVSLGATDYMSNSYNAVGHMGLTTPLWWINPRDYSYEEDVMGDWNNMPMAKNYRAGFAGGLNDIDDSPSRMMGSQSLFGVSSRLNFSYYSADMTGSTTAKRKDYQRGNVTRYLYCPSFLDENITTRVPFLRAGSEDSRDIQATIIKVSKEFTLEAHRQPLTILDGEFYNGDIHAIDPKTIVQAIILKGADAAELYGPTAAEGILVLSTKGQILLPLPEAGPSLPPRKNFNETAFFFPEIYADKDGYYRFSFTMPESVTEWNWKMMAHTKKALFAYAERKLTTQLPLMVQPNMPRLLYQGDRIVLQSRISNLDSSDISGQAICKIEDAVTGEDITASCITRSQNDFSIAKKANVSSAFEVRVPKTQLNPIRITVSARSQNFADGEEHVIPVLSPRILVKKSIPFRFVNSSDTVLAAPVMPNGAELYGAGLSILPKPQSALIHALPYLANYSFDCAEQIFNKMAACITAINLMRWDKEAQRSFEKAQKVTEQLAEKENELPGEIAEGAMPWLNLGHETARQQKQLFELLDTNRTRKQVDSYIAKFYKLQNNDGGLSWFDGGESNAYISNYILAGFGKLEKDSLLRGGRTGWFGNKYRDFIEHLLAYGVKQWEGSKNENSFRDDPLFFVYAQSFWKGFAAQSDALKEKIKSFLGKKWESPGGLYNQAMLVIVTLRYFDPGTTEYKRAIQQLQSIEQLAIRDDVNGIRWKDLADADDMSRSSEETLAMLAEAFSEAGISQELFPGMIKWLMTAKNEDHWSSTKATAAVVRMLLKENKTATGATQTISGNLDTKKLSVTDDLLVGNSFSFVAEKRTGPVGLKKESNVPAAGNMLWYYFSPGDAVSAENAEVKLKKELFRYNSMTSNWEPVDERTILKIADKIKVVLTIEAVKALQYVYIDDKKAAGFEPLDNSSGYQFAKGLRYYQSVRDAGMQFFSEFIPAGRSSLSYEMIVAHEGDFTNGPSSLQCMYKPEVNAYSNGMRISSTR